MSNDIEAIIISVSHGGLVVIGPTPVIDGSELSLLSISTLMANSRSLVNRCVNLVSPPLVGSYATYVELSTLKLARPTAAKPYLQPWSIHYTFIQGEPWGDHFMRGLITTLDKIQWMDIFR